MTDKELIAAMRRLSVETGSLACVGCGREHNCGIHGCAILRAGAERLTELTDELHRAMANVGQEWISVEERLPEVWRNDDTAELVNYMIYSPDFGVDIGNYHAKAKRWLCMALPCVVTHWMPLPPRPEEVE